MSYIFLSLSKSIKKVVFALDFQFLAARISLPNYVIWDLRQTGKKRQYLMHSFPLPLLMDRIKWRKRTKKSEQFKIHTGAEAQFLCSTQTIDWAKKRIWKEYHTWSFAPKIELRFIGKIWFFAPVWNTCQERNFRFDVTLENPQNYWCKTICN